MGEDEDELLVGAMRTLLKRTTGRSGYLVRPISKLIRTVAHELDLALPLPADAVMGRVESVLTSMSQMFDYPPQSDTGRRRIRGIVAGGANGEMPVVVTVDLSPDQAGGTTLKLRASVKELIVNKRTAEKAAQAVAELLTRHDDMDHALAAHTWFEVHPSDAAEMSGAELAFGAALRVHSSAWIPNDVDGYVGGFAADGLEEPLVAAADLTDPADRGGRLLLRAGVHLLGDRVRGDRLHSQLYSLPERPSPWALDATGTHDRLAELSAHWFRRVLDKPIVLYVWLHDDYPYAARYAFADTGETLIQYYERKLAPASQAAELIAAGHVHGKGWIQTVGLPTPSCYLHIRGDFTKGTVLPGVPATTKRGPLPGFWYEGH
jgi:hypothetical protein